MLLADERVNPSLMKRDCLFSHALEANDLGMIKVLLKDGRADTSRLQHRIIATLLEAGDVYTFKQLLSNPESRVDPSSDNNYAIRMSCKNGHLELVELLLKHPMVSPQAEDDYCIRLASQNGHVEIVKLLLADDRVTPSARDK